MYLSKSALHLLLPMLKALPALRLLVYYLFSAEFPEQLGIRYSHHKLTEGITVTLKFQGAQVKDMLPLQQTGPGFYFPPKLPFIEGVSSFTQRTRLQGPISFTLQLVGCDLPYFFLNSSMHLWM